MYIKPNEMYLHVPLACDLFVCCEFICCYLYGLFRVLLHYMKLEILVNTRTYRILPLYKRVDIWWCIGKWNADYDTFATSSW